MTKWLRPSRAQAVSPNFTSRSSRSIAVLRFAAALRIRSGLGDPPPLVLATPALASEASGVLVHHQHPIPILKDTKHMLNLRKLETVEIPLNKLPLWEGNVRTTGAEEALDELIASIRSVGLLQSLVVKKASRGTFVIGAGKRRFLALSQLADTGDVKRSYLVPCRIAPDDADFTEISLAENILRTDSFSGSVRFPHPRRCRKLNRRCCRTFWYQ